MTDAARMVLDIVAITVGGLLAGVVISGFMVALERRRNRY